MKDRIWERANRICECPGGEDNGGEPGSQPCQNLADHIHHIVYPHQVGQETKDMLIALCRTCHETRHGENSVLDTPPCCKYRYEYPLIRESSDLLKRLP